MFDGATFLVDGSWFPEGTPYFCASAVRVLNNGDESVWCWCGEGRGRWPVDMQSPSQATELLAVLAALRATTELGMSTGKRTLIYSDMEEMWDWVRRQKFKTDLLGEVVHWEETIILRAIARQLVAMCKDDYEVYFVHKNLNLQWTHDEHWPPQVHNRTLRDQGLCIQENMPDLTSIRMPEVPIGWNDVEFIEMNTCKPPTLLVRARKQNGL